MAELLRKIGIRQLNSVTAGLAVIVCLTLVPPPALAGGVESKDHITIAAPLVPPYFDKSGEGLEATRIRNALVSVYCPDQIRFAVRPFVQHWRLYASDTGIDAVTTVPKGEAIPGYPSAFYIEYQNGIGYRKSRFPNGITSISDPALDGKKVAAFVDALGILPGLSAKRPNFSSYVENGNQKDNSVLLDRNLVDAVISDRRIFEFYNGQIDGLKDSTDIGFNAVFPPSPYRMVFRSAELRDAFNTGLKNLGAVAADTRRSPLPARCR